VVERDLAKVDVARSNRVTRSFLFIYLTTLVTKNVKKHVKIFNQKIEGESGIRTHGNRKASSDFKSDAFDQLCHLSFTCLQ
jgi:hypothetical protein